MLSATSNSHLHVRSTSITEILEVVARLLEWRATLHLCVRPCVQVWGGALYWRPPVLALHSKKTNNQACIHHKGQRHRGSGYNTSEEQCHWTRVTKSSPHARYMATMYRRESACMRYVIPGFFFMYVRALGFGGFVKVSLRVVSPRVTTTQVWNEWKGRWEEWAKEWVLSKSVRSKEKWKKKEKERRSLELGSAKGRNKTKQPTTTKTTTTKRS